MRHHFTESFRGQTHAASSALRRPYLRCDPPTPHPTKQESDIRTFFENCLVAAEKN